MLEREDMSLKSCRIFSPISLMLDAFPMVSSLHPSILPCPQSPLLVSPVTLSSTHSLALLLSQGCEVELCFNTSWTEAWELQVEISVCVHK